MIRLPMMKRLAQWRSGGLRGVGTLVSGTLVAQLLTFAVTPILSRLYDPDAFGFLSLVVAASGLLAPVVGLRLESALLLPASPRTATALFTLSAASALILTSLAWILLEGGKALGLLSALEASGSFPTWVAAVALLTSWFTLASQFALRAQRYGAVARRGVYQAIVTSLVQLAGYRMPPIGTGLVAGHTLGRVAGILPLVISSTQEFRRFGRQDLRGALKRFWKFPAVFAPSALLNSMGLVLPVLFVGAWFSVSEAGHWGMAERVLSIPVILVGNAVGQVVESTASLKVRTKEDRLTALYIRVSRPLLLLGLTLVVAVIVLAPVLVEPVLGPGWSDTAVLMQAMVAMVALRLVAAPMSKVLVVLQLAKLTFLLDFSRVVLLSIAGVLVVTCDFSITASAVLATGALGVSYALTWLAGLRAARRYDVAVRSA